MYIIDVTKPDADMKVDLNANEVVLKAGDSRFYMNNMKVLGKLILTNQRMIFQALSGAENILKLEFDPAYIKEVFNFNNRFILPNGLCLLTKDGKEWKFEIRDRNNWAAMIARAI